MKKKKIQDERVLSQKRKIGNDAFQIISLGLFLSVLVQQYIFDAPFSQYAVEMILLITVSLYVIVRNIMVGNDIFNSNKVNQRVVIINSIICGIIITIVNTILNYIKFREIFTTDIVNSVVVSLVTFVCASVVSFVVLQILYVINKRKQIQIEIQLEDDDEKN
ncbi:hypothetical protein H8891_07740 [Paeniclostridium sp. NSJ-45]|uniref:DUF2975 domain-containing protein n=1 Tax=Paeniclostridium hominis TaxID=2764329 RepID=A0ABR7K3L3_9FIRM|nr:MULTISPECIES: DUF6773 family protein [Paeniclostridium]MBC6003691.1 hypothetical protein [Paeniclostridium hominis]